MASESQITDPPGLFDRFEVLGPLGEGGMGKVSLAYDRRLRARVALKAVGSVTGKALLRFKHEFRSVKGLAHPNLVSLGELFEQDGRWYLSMEYIDGVSFLDHVRPRTDGSAQLSTTSRPRLRNVQTTSEPGTRTAHSSNSPVTRSADVNDLAFDDGPRGEAAVITDMGDVTGVDFGTEPIEPRNLPPHPGAAWTEFGDGSRSFVAGDEDIVAETIGDALGSIVGGESDPDHDINRSGGNSAYAFEEGRLRHSLLQLVDATHTLHESGRVHRDIKPSNVLVTPTGRVVILDFGLVTELDDERSQAEGAVLGTPAYMAPEQASGLPAGPSADWYAVGVMLYEALCGRWPVVGSSLTIMADKQVHVPRRPSEFTEQSIPADLERLCLDLLAIEPADRPDGPEIFTRLGAVDRRSDAAEIAAGSSTSGSSSTWVRELPCVGRDPQLARIAAMFEQTRAKQPRQVLLVGESGMGKSALVREALGRFSQQVAARPWILRGRCYEHEQVRFKAFDALVDQLTVELPERFAHAELRELLPRHAWLLCRAFPVLQRVKAFADMGVHHGTMQHRGALQRQMFETFRELFARLAERSHLVVVIEDLQWADIGSWSLLTALISGADAPPLAVLATARTELDETAPEVAQPFLAAPTIERITVGPLARADVTKLAELHGRPLGEDSALAQTLFEAAGGHPFFLDVLLRSTTSFEVDKLPSLGECLWTELQQLAAPEAAAMRVLAIADRPLDPPEIGGLAELDPSHLGRALDRLRALQWIRSGSGADAGRIEVFHDQIRQTLRAHLSAGEARATHLALARMLEQRGDELDRLVSHLLAADEVEAAARWAAEAAEQAMDAMAFERAVELYTLALRHPPSDPAAHHALQIAHAHALAWTGRGVEAAEAYLAAERNAERGAGLELRTKAAIHLLSAGQLDAGFDLIEKLGVELGLSVPRSSTTTILHLLRERTMLRLRGFRAPTRAVELRFEEKLRLELCSAAARVYLVHDMFLASYFTTTYVRLALRSQDRANVAIALSLEGVARSYLGHPGKAEELLNAADELLVGVEDSFALGSVAIHRGVHLGLAADDCAAYRDAINRAVRQLRRSGRAERGDDLGVALRGLMTSLGLLMRGIASSRAGDYKSLEGQLREYLDDARARDDRTALIQAYVSPDFGMAHMIRGRPDIPLETVPQGLALIAGDGFSMGHLSALLSQVRCAIYSGRPDQAVSAFEAVRGAMRSSTTVRAPDARAEAAVAEAATFVAMRASQDDPKFRRIAQKPIKFLLAYPGAYHRGRGEAFHAATLALDGDRVGARASLRKALDSLDGCRANGYAAAVRLALATLTDDKDQAREHRTAGLRFFLEAEVKEPERFAEMLTPGFHLA